MVQLSVSSTLADISVGESVDIVGYADHAPIRRFAQMGLVPGRQVTAVRTAPLGDPVEYAVMGSRVAMRRTDADAILVQATGS